MNGTRLTAAEQRRLSEILHHTHDVRLYRRPLAVLEYCCGKGVVELARSLHVSRQSVHNCFHQASKATALADAPRSERPRREAVDKLLQVLMILPPERFGCHAAHWTVPLLQNQVRQNLSQTCSDATVRHRLHRLGYV